MTLSALDPLDSIHRRGAAIRECRDEQQEHHDPADHQPRGGDTLDVPAGGVILGAGLSRLFGGLLGSVIFLLSGLLGLLRWCLLLSRLLRLRLFLLLWLWLLGRRVALRHHHSG
jgi:hypothetical protein